MQDEIWHDSQSAVFRRPFGAVACGENIVLAVKVRPELRPAKVMLRLFTHTHGEKLAGMERMENTGGELWYQIVITAPEQPEIIWYYFILDCEERRLYYGNNDDNLGGIGKIAAGEPPSYQITVHKKGAVTPNWFKDSVMYQIFVDRFYNGLEDGKVLKPRKGCLLHASWEDVPVYARDMETGEILAYDFFGGNLKGVLKKLDYLKELGVSVIYFNPIFESPSNHKYDTADYKHIDRMFGDEETFRLLCAKAEEMGIRIFLDGVFSHTGSDSIYFNKEGTYETVGAYQSTASPYYSWFRFQHHPDQYESWWGIGNLPNVEETEPTYLDYIIRDNDSVLKKWLKAGAKGWRLDVVDELPDSFVKLFYKTMKEADPEAVLIGEVWEDASRKTSYGALREYLWGDELDSLMNYPFRTSLHAFMLGYIDAGRLNRELMSIYENYPVENFYVLMNLIGTHDVARVLTLMGEAPGADSLTKAQQGRYRLPGAQLALGMARVKLLALWQMTFPGVPCVYYGDEAGLEGFADPLNRGSYPWGHENQELLAWHKNLIQLRNRHDMLRTGKWQPVYYSGNVYAYIRFIENRRDQFGREAENNAAIVLLNRGRETETITLDIRAWCPETVYDVLNANEAHVLSDGRLTVSMEPLSGKLLMNTPDGLIREDGESGILLHPTSLPSEYGIGDLGPEAYRFIDFLETAGQRLWQILPLNPIGFGDSPYQCLSAFAGNFLLISPDKLVESGLLSRQEVEKALEGFKFPAAQVDFPGARTLKESLCRLAYEHFQQQAEPGDYREFCRENAFWLEEYVLFIALREHFNGVSWQEWPEALRQREAATLEHYRILLAGELRYQRFLQYIFFGQWAKLKEYASQKHIRIIGDLPIFVAYDSSDVWANQHLFSLDDTGKPEKVAGVPPDYFSETGQLWGNPHYLWEEMAKDDYLWWRQRCNQLLRMVDLIRIDHFRGFEAYWEIPAGEQTAVNGKWVKGPGAAFFAMLQQDLGELPFIAEDLGIITDDVRQLKDEFGLPGMKVLQFALLSHTKAEEMSLNYNRNSIVYTGTHDNDTTIGWYKKLRAAQPEEAERLLKLLEIPGASPEEVGLGMMKFALSSNAHRVILPLQDILGLDTECRMNFPGTVGGNWQWRYVSGSLKKELAASLKVLSQKNRRTGWAEKVAKIDE